MIEFGTEGGGILPTGVRENRVGIPLANIFVRLTRRGKNVSRSGNGGMKIENFESSERS